MGRKKSGRKRVEIDWLPRPRERYRWKSENWRPFSSCPPGCPRPRAVSGPPQEPRFVCCKEKAHRISIVATNPTPSISLRSLTPRPSIHPRAHRSPAPPTPPKRTHSSILANSLSNKRAVTRRNVPRVRLVAVRQTRHPEASEKAPEPDLLPALLLVLAGLDAEQPAAGRVVVVAMRVRVAAEAAGRR